VRGSVALRIRQVRGTIEYEYRCASSLSSPADTAFAVI
jgi:hypothetical protein